MTATVAGIHLGIDTHANRPAAGTPPVGSLYSCSTHSLVYRTDGSTWSTWATLGSTGSGTLTTVEEVDGSPTDSAVTKIVFPNGTLAIASHVATYTPTGGGTGNLTAPSAVTVDLGASNLLTRRAVVNAEDDLFDAGSLDAKWLAYTSGDITTDLASLPGWLGTSTAGSKLQAVPAGDWTIETEAISGGLTASGFQDAGLILTNGTTATSATDCRFGTGMNNDNRSYRIVVEKFVNNAFSSTYQSWDPASASGGFGVAVDHLFLRINKSGTTYRFDVSTTGKTWHVLFSTGSLGFTPTHFGVHGDVGSFWNGFYRY